jgi:hypothetical protein
MNELKDVPIEIHGDGIGGIIVFAIIDNLVTNITKRLSDSDIKMLTVEYEKGKMESEENENE